MALYFTADDVIRKDIEPDNTCDSEKKSFITGAVTEYRDKPVFRLAVEVYLRFASYMEATCVVAAWYV